jgi:hypothetical protein
VRHAGDVLGPVLVEANVGVSVGRDDEYRTITTNARGQFAFTDQGREAHGGVGSRQACRPCPWAEWFSGGECDGHDLSGDGEYVGFQVTTNADGADQPERSR